MRISKTVLKILNALTDRNTRVVSNDVLTENLVKEPEDAVLVPTIECHGYRYCLSTVDKVRAYDKKTSELLLEFQLREGVAGKVWSIRYASPEAIKRFSLRSLKQQAEK